MACPGRTYPTIIVALYRKGLAPGTIQGKLAALGFYAKANGFRDFSGDFWIRKMREGWSRERGRIQDDRTPISPVLLERLCELWGSLCKDSYVEALFHAAALVAFFGAMRISSSIRQRGHFSEGLAAGGRNSSEWAGKD